MISDNSIENLKNQIDIVDIISNSLELVKAGANFKACCPFHGEDTPSFVISPVKQICHCFGCGVGGDAIWFIQEHFNYSYPEAIEHIANDLNFTLEYTNKENKKDYKSLMESINNFYIKNLKNKELKYLLNRGVTKESIEKFEIGYAADTNSQIQYLKNNFFNIKDCCDVGVLAIDNNKTYSRLISRITFPIRNHTGKLIGFGGRTTIGHNAKYVNSINTKLFDKSRNLYGLNLAREHIYKKGTIVITEGYLDVVMMHQANIKTTVATMGTALTLEHCIIIKKMKCKVILCYDGDKAGKAAAYKASVLLSQHYIDGTVVIFDDGIDPADMVKDNKTKELINLMLNGTPFINFVLKHIVDQYDLNNPLEKDKARVESIQFLNSLKNQALAVEYKNYLATILNIDIKYIQLDNITINKNIQQNNSPLAATIELSLIATALDSFNALELLYKIDPNIFEYHKEELKTLLAGGNGIDNLDWIALKDGIMIYDDKEFKTQLSLLLIEYTNKEIKNVRTQEIDTSIKIEQIKKLQKKILDYKEQRI